MMDRVREGELGALAGLFERHHRSLFRYFAHLGGSRETSEDLVQEVFVRILKYRMTFQPGADFAPWMYQIARNTHADAMRKRRFEVIPGGANLGIDDTPSSEAPAEERIGKRQETALLRRALEALPEDKREILVLSRFQNLKYEQIAALLGCEVNTVKVRVFRAVRALGQEYERLAQQRACGA
jgi:RNA polymerase sigma factor (sigma-70 family)